MNDITTKLQTFNFGNSAIRAITREGAPWFVATDIAKALGFETAKDMARILDDDEKGRHIVPTLGGPQEVSIINESGLYAVILRSRKPEAKAFRRWVTGTVLPAIRKTGAFGELKNMRELPHGHAIINERDAEQVAHFVGRIKDSCNRLKSGLGMLSHHLADLSGPAERMAHAVKFGSLDAYGLRDEIFRVLSRAGKKGVAWERVKHRSKILKGANGEVNDVIHEMVSNGEIARLIIGEQVTLFSPSSTPTLSPVKTMLEHGSSSFM